jgi:hypothetical protein
MGKSRFYIIQVSLWNRNPIGGNRHHLFEEWRRASRTLCTVVLRFFDPLASNTRTSRFGVEEQDP